MKISRNIPGHISYLFMVYAAGILMFTLFRFLLFVSEFRQLEHIPDNLAVSLIMKALFMGFRFDTVVSGYILAVPFLLLSLATLMKHGRQQVYFFNMVLICMLYFIAFLICAVDIPMFNYSFSRLTVSALAWMNTPMFVFKMIFQEITYFWVVVPLLAISTAFFLINVSLYKKQLLQKDTDIRKTGAEDIVFRVLVVLAAAVILFAGVRGRLTSKSPIRVGTAYFSSYAFPNKLGLNPVFTFARSYLDSRNPLNERVNFMEDEDAIKRVQELLNTSGISGTGSPIARAVSFDNDPIHANVIIVIMESMSTAKMGRYGNKHNLTPTLDSLAAQGHAFDNIYTAGIHTYNGVYSTLFSFPTIKRQHPLKSVSMLTYAGIGSMLKKEGYETIYFTTHDDQFDNIGGFLTANDFNRIVSLKDYPAERVASTLGIPDDYMFEYAIPILNNLSNDNKKFLSVFLTASDHGPYVIPGYFDPTADDTDKQIVEYADWAIGKFMRMASQQQWFNNTLFVFIADHGAPMNVTYEMPLNYHHTPLIFYAPELLKQSMAFDVIGGQIDVFPTIMGILNLPYVNNTLGIDLYRERRPYIYFGSDTQYGVLNHEFFLVVNESRRRALYRYNSLLDGKKDVHNYVLDNSGLVHDMMTYAESMMQTAQWLIHNRLVGIDD